MTTIIMIRCDTSRDKLNQIKKKNIAHLFSDIHFNQDAKAIYQQDTVLINTECKVQRPYSICGMFEVPMKIKNKKNMYNGGSMMVIPIQN